jgi:hypothetical protein
MPTVFSYFPSRSVFGFETTQSIITDPKVTKASTALHGSYARMNNRISWRQLQATPGGPINWSRLEGFKEELRLLQSVQIKPVVIVDDFPHWAVQPFGDGKLSSCAALTLKTFLCLEPFWPS